MIEISVGLYCNTSITDVSATAQRVMRLRVITSWLRWWITSISSSACGILATKGCNGRCLSFFLPWLYAAGSTERGSFGVYAAGE